MNSLRQVVTWRALSWRLCALALIAQITYAAEPVSVERPQVAGPDAYSSRSGVGGLGGGERRPVEHPPCATSAEWQAVRQAVADYERRFGPLSEGSPDDPPFLYPFYPMAGTLYGDLFTNNFVDLDPSVGVLDWDCTDFSYNGHDASDVDLRSFGEQIIGVPIFAALDGIVVATHDGEPDMNRCPNSPCSSAANYVIVDHGSGRLCYYWHMKRGSVGVSVGQRVSAGQQIGLTGSSGNSSGPHLHFATYDNGVVYEPYAGQCRPGPSGWVNQTPIRRDLYLRDFGVTYEDMSSFPGPPSAFPRSGQIAFTDPYVYFWALPLNLPTNSTWRVRFQRPNGTFAYDSGNRPFGNTQFYRWSWWWWFWDIPDMHSITGTWHIELYMNGALQVSGPVEVRVQRTPDFNRPPEPITVAFDPPRPRAGDVIFCRVDTSLVLDDLDYDIVHYEYVWTVCGSEVRRVSSAAHSDAMPTQREWVGSIQCTVTPRDGRAFGPVASVAWVIDFDGDGDVDLADFLLFQLCFGGSNNPPAGTCPAGVDGDLDGDGDVDLADFLVLLECFTGSW